MHDAVALASSAGIIRHCDRSGRFRISSEETWYDLRLDLAKLSSKGDDAFVYQIALATKRDRSRNNGETGTVAGLPFEEYKKRELIAWRELQSEVRAGHAKVHAIRYDVETPGIIRTPNQTKSSAERIEKIAPLQNDLDSIDDSSSDDDELGSDLDCDEYSDGRELQPDEVSELELEHEGFDLLLRPRQWIDDQVSWWSEVKVSFTNDLIEFEPAEGFAPRNESSCRALDRCSSGLERVACLLILEAYNEQVPGKDEGIGPSKMRSHLTQFFSHRPDNLAKLKTIKDQTIKRALAHIRFEPQPNISAPK